MQDQASTDFVKSGRYSGDQNEAVRRAQQKNGNDDYGQMTRAEDFLTISREDNTFEMGGWSSTYYHGSAVRDEGSIKGTLEVKDGVGYCKFDHCCEAACIFKGPINGSFELHVFKNTVKVHNFVEGQCRHCVKRGFPKTTFYTR